MPEWTSQVIWWVCGTGAVCLLLGWLFGRFGGARVSRSEHEALVVRERSGRKELNDTRAQQASIADEVHELRDQNLMLSGELDASQRLIQESRSSASSDSMAFAAAVPEGSGSSTEIHEAHGVIASLREELDSARLRYADLYSSQSKLSAELDTATSRMTKAETERVRAATDLGEARSLVEELSGSTDTISADLDAATNRLAEAEAERARAAEGLIEARGRVDELTISAQTMQADLDTAAQRLDSIQRRSAASGNDLYAARTRVADVESRLSAALEALREASTDLTTVQEDINANTGDDMSSLPAPPAPAVTAKTDDMSVFDLSESATAQAADLRAADRAAGLSDAR